MAVAAVVLLYGLEGTPMRPYDEGLYGRLARNALENDAWVHAVEADGSFSTKFSKPPLSIWLTAATMKLLGPSMLSLRLPFALCAWLGIGMCTAWGIRAGGLRLGAAWGLTLTLCGATLRWGRYASIEPMFVAFGLLAMWAQAESLHASARQRSWWALLSGSGLALALLTKQLAAGLFVLPMFVVEAVMFHRAPRAGRWSRWALVFATPIAWALAWFAAAYRSAGDALTDTFFVHSVAGRVMGESLNAKTLNEVAGILDEVVAPFPWSLGLIALVAAAAWSRRTDADADADEGLADRTRTLVIAMAALAITATVLYDLTTRTLLPWYPFAFVPPITAGLAWTIDRLCHLRRDDAGPQWLAAGVGAAVIAIGVVTATRPWLSEPTLAIALAGLAVAAWRGAGSRAPAVRDGALVVCAGLVFVGTMRSPEFRQGPGGLETLMRRLGERDAKVVAVDRDTGATLLVEYGAYFGPKAIVVPAPPWRRPVPGVQAYVSARIPPRELRVADGQELIRAPGAIAIVGDLSRPAWDADISEHLLAEGPLTFEAEDLPTQRVETLTADDEASGGWARAYVPFRGEPSKQFLVTSGPDWPLPAGSYRADFRVRWSCPGPNATVARLWILAGEREVAKVDLGCEDGGHDDWTIVAVPFRLGRPGRIELRVVYMAGAIWHDTTTVTARG